MVDPHKAPMCASVCPLSDSTLSDAHILLASQPFKPPACLTEHTQKQTEKPHKYCEHRGLNLDSIPSLESNIKYTESNQITQQY